MMLDVKSLRCDLLFTCAPPCFLCFSPAPSVDFGYMSNIEDNVQLKFGGVFVFLSFVLFVWCAA